MGKSAFLTLVIFLTGCQSVVDTFDGRVVANQKSTEGSLRTVYTACITYQSAYGHFPEKLSDLGTGKELSPADIRHMEEPGGWQPGPKHAGFIDTVLETGKKSGYLIIYEATARDRKGRVTKYKVVASPQVWGETGRMSYFMDQTGMISFTEQNRPATENDPFLPPR